MQYCNWIIQNYWWITLFSNMTLFFIIIDQSPKNCFKMTSSCVTVDIVKLIVFIMTYMISMLVVSNCLLIIFQPFWLKLQQTAISKCLEVANQNCSASRICGFYLDFQSHTTVTLKRFLSGVKVNEKKQKQDKNQNVQFLYCTLLWNIIYTCKSSKNCQFIDSFIAGGTALTA